MQPIVFEPATPERVLEIMKASMFEEKYNYQNLGLGISSKLDIYVHQVETVLRAMGMEYPRLILADEVGLGKTIEALLIVKELEKMGKGKRCLFLVPASLVTQWQYEMNEKFVTFPSILSSDDLQFPGILDNGFYLCSIDLAKRYPDFFTDQNWDIVLVDEAHHLRRQMTNGRSVKVTQNYRLAENLVIKTNSLLLLTATPMQLDEFEFYSLLSLVNSDYFPNYESFQYYYNHLLPRIGSIIERLQNGNLVPKAEIEMVRQRTVELFTNFEVPSPPENCDTLQLLEYFHSLLIFPKLMIRHRRRIEFPDLLDRDVKTIQVHYSEEEMNVYNEVREMLRTLFRSRDGGRNLGMLAINYQQMLTSSPRAISSSLERSLRGSNLLDTDDGEDSSEDRVIPNQNEMKIREYIQRIRELPTDSKLETLLGIVSEILMQDPSEKIIIFTRFLETQRYLANYLGANFHVVTFNGKMDEVEKNANIEEFKNNANVLISTEAGGEGRNFQFCHIMINYDLPWNPMRLEQRIGRIDRIGQRKRVIVYNLMIANTVETQIFLILMDRFSRFQNLLGGSDVILGDVQRNIANIVFDTEEEREARIRSFVKTLDDRIEKAREAEEYFDHLSTFQRNPKERAKASAQVKATFPMESLECFIISHLGKIPEAAVTIVDGVYAIKVKNGSKLGNKSDINLAGSFNTAECALNMDHIFIKQIMNSLLARSSCAVSFEALDNHQSMVNWCFYGGPDKGYCVITYNDGDCLIESPDEVIEWKPNVSSSSPIENMLNSTYVMNSYEKARLLAEKHLRYPNGGVVLIGARFVNFPEVN